MPSPKFARAFNAAVAASERGDIKAARKHLKKALKEAPRDAGVLHHLGLICQQLGDIDESVRYLKRAVAADPADAVAFNNLGNVLLARGDGAAAADAYRQSISLRPDYVNALF
ncbi:MAG TPA: tetratricopeptide repeat protein, partial [Gammaproteobacteria bacterium]